MRNRKKTIELPLVEPVYQTYHEGIVSACISKNSSMRNWFLSNALMLTCERRFLSGYTSPEIRVENHNFYTPILETKWLYMEFLGGYINPIIRNMIDEGYYVMFTGVDDYYIPEKSWYKERHFIHDGTICGYNQGNKTYCIYAYDSNWVYRKFWVPQKAFNKGREAAMKKGVCGTLCAIKPKADHEEFSVESVRKHLKDYLDSDETKYPKEGEGNIRGIVVHEYIGMYIDKLLDGTIPYERMDSRVFRLIWEHKKVMLESIENVERHLNMNSEISEKYQELVTEADTMRMLYAAHHARRRDSLLPTIKKRLLRLMEKEKELLALLLEKVDKKYF